MSTHRDSNGPDGCSQTPPWCAPPVDPRPYHERRREMASCPACGDPDCYSLVCDEPELRDPAYEGD